MSLTDNDEMRYESAPDPTRSASETYICIKALNSEGTTVGSAYGDAKIGNVVILVDTNYRRRGIGNRLVEAYVARVKEVSDLEKLTLVYPVTKTDVVGLLEKNGFTSAKSDTDESKVCCTLNLK